ncbi:hypothetical protein MMC13_005521 [Lambiella insularis]|nr:hypothetical protein [Lambiella insularis]
MHLVYLLSLAAFFGLTAVHVQAFPQPFGAGLSRLLVRAIDEKPDQQFFDDHYERDLYDLCERDNKDFFGQAIDGTDLFPRADSPHSPRGSTCSGSRSRTPSPRFDWIQVRMGKAMLLPLPTRESGIETTGICGCTGVAVVGREGIAVAHVAPGDSAAIREIGTLSLRVGPTAVAYIYAPAEREQFMDQQEVNRIRGALGRIVPTVIPYPFIPGSMRQLAVSSSGSVYWD